MFSETKDPWKTTRLFAAVFFIAWLVGLSRNNGVRPLLGAEDSTPKQSAVEPPAPPADPGQPSPGSLPEPQIQPVKATERAVPAALGWLARHQMADGSWSFQRYTDRCTDKSCTGHGGQESLSAATAMGVLPFLAAGQSPTNKGPYQKTVDDAIHWLINHQKPDGDLSADAASQMYSHGLAAIALCECYRRTKDKSLGDAAQKAIRFIESAQNTTDGGWRYHPGDEGDTSVFGWQVSALKSGQLAGLTVKQETFDLAQKWLQSVAKTAADGTANGRFSYQPEGGATPCMSAAGLLCSQKLLHSSRTDPAIVGGVKYLMENQPDAKARNVYYWFYANQVLNNMQDRDWDVWNRTQRKILVTSQAHEGCAAGSWDPDKPTRDAWGPQGGRVMMTSFSCLVLEETLWHRFGVLYKVDEPTEKKPQEPAGDSNQPSPGK